MLFEKYRAAGLCVVPLKNGIPAVKWGQFQEKMPDDVSAWEKYNEYALVCGRVSGVVALDIDTDDEQIISEIYGFVPQSPVNKIGSKGFTAFYRYNGEKTKNWGGVVEVLSDKHLTTLPPSKHREKNLCYEWVDGIDLIGADLPYLPDDFYAFMESKFPSPVRIEVSPSIYRIEHGDVTLDDAANMLRFIPADIGRDEWLSIGMALRHEFGDVACGLFHEWSKSGKGYKAKDAHYAWKSFNKSGFTIATVFHMAQLNGWHPEPIARADADTSLADAFVKKIELGKKEENRIVTPTVVEKPARASVSESSSPLPFDPLKLDGLIGDTVRWICSDAMFKQPELALLNVISFAGSVLGRRYASPVNTRTNIYMVGIAGTANGKDHSRKKIRLLAEAAGLSDFIGADSVISDTGLARSIRDNPCQLFMLDEFGKFLQGINDKGAGSWSKKIVKLMMSMYSDSSSIYKHGDYANKKANESITIHSPNLCIYGTTTEKEYVKALSKDAVESGELNRFMVVKVADVPIKRVDTVTPIPQYLIDRWERFSHGAFGIVANGSIDCVPKTVEWGDCSKLQWDIAEQQDAKVRARTLTSSLWGRRRENIIKIAMIFAVLRNKEAPEMCAMDFNIAVGVTDSSIKYMESLVCDGLAENDHESSFIEVLKFIRSFDGDGVARSAITQRFRKHKLREINDMLSSMLDQGVVMAERVDGKGNKPVTIYKTAL